MFLYILEASAVSSFSACIGLVLPLAILLFPFAIIVTLFSLLCTLVCLPLYLLIVLPVSLRLYNQIRDNPIRWALIFAVLEYAYGLMISVLGQDLNNTLSEVLYFNKTMSGIFVIHGALTGFFMWGALFGNRFSVKSHSLNPK